MESIGNLTVRVSAAQQAIPVSGASVTIYDPAQPLGAPIARSTTDQSGQSALFSLPAPPLENSESPDMANPFRSYTVRVSHPDYATVQIEGVSIFPGITASLPVSLVPSRLGADTESTLQIQTGPSGAGEEHA
ncbi:MAG: carboxypeptidase-like regulatory domain-containing protein [Eubacteriales bacterium]|nr:carboxypeptidase-like regulatory domain-containing protein [Eubacteriales bacterium]